ncbi:hypothetical protein PQO03_16810 [Lentisphaera profundi]|uniref:PhoU domain-containing protein n=1 Tax=Lentisphaera profundi TaxID=1658616 RepID=A0ABY7VTG8_9BACT|nr:hypothetical protein [Lentisphaera profundi]WDE97490.1 hypothetical protein PQO03_16810 [Lentisphaera profundi]
MKPLKNHLIKSIIKSQNTQSAEELINLEERSKLIFQNYNKIHYLVKKKTQGIKANLTRLVNSPQHYSEILIDAQALKVTIDDLKESSVMAHKKHHRYMSRKQRDYYELMMNYIRAISLSVEIIIDKLQVVILRKQGSNHPKTSRTHSNITNSYYAASRRNCNNITKKLSIYS